MKETTENIGPNHAGSPDRGRESPKLSLSLVGSASASVAQRPLPLKRRKMIALLGYLALSEKQVETRERLVGLLWSEVNEEKARMSFRQTLHGLRSSFDEAGFAGLFADKLKVALSPELVRVDVWEAILAAESGSVAPQLLETPNYCDNLLTGFEDIDPAYRVWLLARRRSLHDRMLRGLEATLADPTGRPGDREQAAEAIANLDPTHEEAIRHLMRAKALAGQTAAALRLYQSLWKLLDDDYAMEPSQETQQLVVAIKQGSIDEHPPPPRLGVGDTKNANPNPAAAPPRRLVLAVEPFSTEAGYDQQRHLLHGFRHSVIACLVRFREWHVMDLGEPSLDAAHLGAHFVIQATAVTPGNTMAVVLTLKDLHSGVFVWSDRFELRIEEWMALQRRVVRSITTALNIHLSAARMTRISKPPNIPAHLYDAWLRGQSMIMRLDPGDWRRASALFADVIQQAPGFAPAYSSLVQLKNSQHIVHPGVFRSRSAQRDALALAQTATRLDPIDSRTQLCLAWAYAFNDQYENAEMHFDLAQSLNDNDPWTLMSTAQGFAFLADDTTASRLANAATAGAARLPPLHSGYLAGIRFFLGDYRGALAAATAAGDFLPSNGAWRAASLVRLGRRKAARREAASCLRLIRERWRGAPDPTDADITAWLLQLFPIRRDSQRERLRRSLASAGFPA